MFRSETPMTRRGRSPTDQTAIPDHGNGTPHLTEQLTVVLAEHGEVERDMLPQLADSIEPVAFQKQVRNQRVEPCMI